MKVVHLGYLAFTGMHLVDTASGFRGRTVSDRIAVVVAWVAMDEAVHTGWGPADLTLFVVHFRLPIQISYLALLHAKEGL